MTIKRIYNGRYQLDGGRYTILRTEFGWHIFAGDTCDDDAWVNGAYDTLREAKDVIARIEANPKWRAETDALLERLGHLPRIGAIPA